MTTSPDRCSTVRDEGTMLIVDDDPTVRLLHRVILERRGYQVVTAAGGTEALAAVDDHDISLILLDSRMPGMSGSEVVSELRSRGLGLPVVMVTAAGERAERVAGLEGGADDYLVKPVDPSELGARVVALLRGREAAVRAATDGRGQDRLLRRRVLDVIDGESFHPVYQPILDLELRTPVAYEALTRFDDGQRPDARFADAERVGLGRELEMGTLAASIRGAAVLPEGVSLHLNVSPSLLRDHRLASLVRTCRRPVVVELTEHARIDDYDAVITGLAWLGQGVRLAIDDAGAGFASMTHILALQPDEVKLDRLWVTGVDVDTARQALIAGMVSFASATGTVLVAEGVETEAEARTLAGLGVARAQGFHFGRPSPHG